MAPAIGDRVVVAFLGGWTSTVVTAVGTRDGRPVFWVNLFNRPLEVRAKGDTWRPAGRKAGR